jgi:hypothetical protein
MKTTAKMWMQLLATILAAVLPIFMDTAHMGLPEWINVATLAIGAAVVWNTSNTNGWKYGKAVGSAFISVLVLFTSFYSAGLSLAEIIQMVLAFLAPLGVLAIRNEPINTDQTPNPAV